MNGARPLSPRQRGYIIGLAKRRHLDEGTQAVVGLALDGKLPQREIALLIERINQMPKKRRQRRRKASP